MEKIIIKDNKKWLVRSFGDGRHTSEYLIGEVEIEEKPKPKKKRQKKETEK